MGKRFVSIWFQYLKTDWVVRRRKHLTNLPFVLATPEHGRLVISAANTLAERQGIFPGLAVADARATVPALEVFEDKPGIAEPLLQGLAGWCIRYAPVVSVDLPDGIVLEATGCPHLWGGEMPYLEDITTRLRKLGYAVRAAIADTIAAAWALARFGTERIAGTNSQAEIIRSLPPAALRLDTETIDRLQKLGLRRIGDFMNLSRTALRRRFTPLLLQRLDQALGQAEESLTPVVPIEPYQERLPALDPILTRTGIEIALKQLLEILCKRLQQESKGLRNCTLKGFRTDGTIETVTIGTSRASHNPAHLFTLFFLCLDSMRPEPGIELFLLEASAVEEVKTKQSQLWKGVSGLEDPALGELLDRIAIRLGSASIKRYLPAEHYWPERSVMLATALDEVPATRWNAEHPRPVTLLHTPEPISVAAPIPDYPPMHFRYKSKLHKIVRADGPERIEQEWWLEQGKHRDYYYVEDEEGNRYWLFRLGHYTGDKNPEWFLHGFFP